jgi:tetratricopeptide (TPR) repeat protein
MNSQDMLNEALRLHQTSRLKEAFTIYCQILQLEPHHAHALHLAGLIFHQFGQQNLAVKLIGRAIHLNPNYSVFYGNIALALLASDRIGDAGITLLKALCLNPAFFEAHNNFGNALQKLGRFSEACAAYSKALRIQPHYADAYNNFGNALQELGRFEEALEAYIKATRINSNFIEAFNSQGNIFVRLGRLEDAVKAYRAALGIQPGSANIHYNLGNALYELGQFEAAIAAYSAALQYAPGYALAYNNRGSALLSLERLDQAESGFMAAVCLAPGLSLAYNNLGAVRQERGQISAAILAFEIAHRINPEFAEAIYNESLCRLLTGDLEAGWRQYEWRRFGGIRGMKSRVFAQPEWQGEEINGRTILLYSEQALGDIIQFCRYATVVSSLGARVILEVPRPLLRLLRNLQGVALCIAEGDPIPDFDVHCPVMSLPHKLETQLRSIPGQEPYLFADPLLAQVWRERIRSNGKPRIGLVWSGGFRPDQPASWAVNRRRNMSLALFEPLGRVNADFFSLQKGDLAEQELADLERQNWAGPKMVNFMDQVTDFSDTAAIIENLDLVISVDTSTAHLAAAMGKPVWILNRFDTCWRWLLNRDDSPWYPTVRLFRQQSRGDWSGVIDRVCAELDKCAGPAPLRKIVN